MKIPPDYSLIRNGLPLEHWLWELLDESQAARIEAGEVLQAMEWGLPSVHTDWDDLAEFPDTDSQRVRFAAGVKAAMAKPEFDTALYVEKLGAFRLTLTNDWTQRVSQSRSMTDARDDKYDRLAGRLVESINSTNDEAARERARQRLAKLSAIYVCGGGQRDPDTFDDAESMKSSAIAAHCIFELLDIELMAAPAVLEALLADSKLRDYALSAIARIGPPAVVFAPQFMEELDRLPHLGVQWPRFDAARALGAIGRDNPLIVNEIVQRLTHDKPDVRKSAATVLQFMGSSVCNRVQEICDLLLPMLEREDECSSALVALASVGRDLPHMRAIVLAFAKPRAPKMRVYAHCPDVEYDQTMCERGTAITAMQYFIPYPEECLPILIDAMQSYVEFDPDHCYRGPHGRIATLIAEFGASAAVAVMPLVAHLHDEREEMPVCILEALASIGPAASAALPAIHELRQRYADDDLPDVATEVIDRIHDLPGWTIQQIQGVPKT